MSRATFDLVRPRGDALPVVVSVPHAGVEVPAEDRATLVDAARARAQDADLFVDRLVSEAPERGATLLVAHISRHVVDLNRAPHDLDPEVCAQLSGHPAATPRSLIWRLATDGTPLLTRPHTVDEVRSRIERLYRPYHAILSSLLDEQRKRFGAAVLLDVHSMPSRSRVDGQPLPEVVLSDVFGTTCAPSLVDAAERGFRELGLQVARNVPYAGGYIVRRYGGPEEGMHALQIEMRRDLYLDEERLTYDGERANEIASALLALVDKLGMTMG